MYKAHFVVRGDKQQPGEDYEETFVAGVRPETFRAIMAMVAAHNREAHAWDIVFVFLNALLNSGKVIYI